MKRVKLALTKKEILAELKKLGITNPSDLRSFLWEYKYYALQTNTSISSSGTSSWNRKQSPEQKTCKSFGKQSNN